MIERGMQVRVARAHEALAVGARLAVRWMAGDDRLLTPVASGNDQDPGTFADTVAARERAPGLTQSSITHDNSTPIAPQPTSAAPSTNASPMS